MPVVNYHIVRVDIPKATPEPEPAKTKMRVEINSARAALRASALPNSDGLPTAMLEIGILRNLRIQIQEMLCSLSLSLVALLSE